MEKPYDKDVLFLKNRNHDNRQNRCIFPNYRWCGPSCSGPGRPINDVDACCRRHDLCYDQRKSSCRCDSEFLDCLRPKVNVQTKKGREAALMYHAIKLKSWFMCN
ncbi:phospholipase [Bacillus sp. CGMCC 1.16607]|uniref:phospholipase n=1 Tax=Bacillus sp. CGMCC 1.16607 TaxID=3351842 RepID=UPI00363F9862